MRTLDRLKMNEAKIEKRDILFLRKVMIDFREKVKTIMQEENCTEEDVFKIIREDIDKTAIPTETVYENGVKVEKEILLSRSDTFLMKTIEQIKRTNDTFSNIINRNRDNLNNSYSNVFDGNYERNKLILVQEALEYLAPENTIHILNGEIPKDKLDKVDYLIMKQYDDLYLRAKESDEKCYTITLKKMLDFLRKYGVLEENTNLHNERMKSLGLPFMQVKYQKESKKDKSKTMEDLLSDSAVDKMQISLKKALLAFYSNRAVKKVDEINRCIYIARRIGGLDNIEKASDEELKKYISGYKILASKIREKIDKGIKRISQIPKRREGRVTLDNIFLEVYNDIDEKEYNQYYGKCVLQDDISEIMSSSSSLQSFFNTKDWSSEVLIMLALDYPTELNMSNWGYIPEVNEYGKNTIEQGKNNILIGFDIPKLNMPIRLHMKLERLQDLIESLRGEEKRIPVYKGYDDFNVYLKGRETNLTAQVIVPALNSQRNSLKQKVKTMDNTELNPNLIQHLNWISNRMEMPKRLYGKQQIVDLETGKIITKNQENPDTSDLNR